MSEKIKTAHLQLNKEREELEMEINPKNINFPNIEKKFPNGFPEGYKPWIDGLAFTPQELKETLPDGAFKLLTMDIAINPDKYVDEVNAGLAEELLNRKTARELTEQEKKELRKRAVLHYSCEIGCEHCYSCGSDIENPLMRKEEVFEVVKEAKELGLKSVKFLEPGELMHNENLFEILDFYEENNIKIIIFTKGIIFGDNELSRKIHKMPSKNLTEKISRYKNTGLIVGFSAFTKEIEEKRIRSKIVDFCEKRNKGLENLVGARMNENIENPRLFLISAPVLKDNIDEALPIYKYGLERNMPVILAPTMISGKGKNMQEITDDFFKQEELVELYVNIYSYLLDNKIFTFKQVEKEGISPYAGIPCAQFISGMFIRTDGRAQACPGNEGEPYRYAKDIRKTNLKDVWKNSLGYKLRKELVENNKDLTTQICYAKTEGDLVQVGSGSIPQNFYNKVLERIKNQYAKN